MIRTVKELKQDHAYHVLRGDEMLAYRVVSKRLNRVKVHTGETIEFDEVKWFERETEMLAHIERRGK